MRHYVYIIGAKSPGKRRYEAIKIGISQSVPDRLEELQTANHRQLEVVKDYAVDSFGLAKFVESEAHKGLSEYRIHREWFEPNVKAARDVLDALVPYDQDSRRSAITRPPGEGLMNWVWADQPAGKIRLK